MEASKGDGSSVDRNKMLEQLDKELEEFIQSRPKTPYKDGFSEDNWENEMQLHPAFRTDAFVEGEELPPLVEAMQQLKYDPDENTPFELAGNYKEDGNYNFKMKKYRWAIDSYTEGIKQNCEDEGLNAQLYTNRATAHFYLGNFRSSISDCNAAIKCKADHMKAIVRAAKCCEKLQNYEEGLVWCEMGLKLDENNDDLIRIKSTLNKQKKMIERDNRKNRIANHKLQMEEENLLQTIKNKGICLENADGKPDISLSNIEPCHPGAIGSRVHMDGTGHLIWPVLFLYPEYGQTDFIREFNENDSFIVHLETMFGESPDVERPVWDLDKKYVPKELKIYFEEKKANILWEVNAKQSLGDVLRHQRFIVYGGSPTFIITVKSTPFHKQFQNNYDEIKSVD